MLAKLTSKNQLTLPKAIVEKLPKTEYFDVQAEGGRIVLTPVQLQKMEAIWRKLEALGITEKDVDDAVKWARGQK
jgi:hypothetical protein